MEHNLHTPLQPGQLAALRAGERVRLSGEIYTARDAAHRRMAEAMRRGEAPPFALAGAVIYYAGPTPARPGQVVGSIGPTTAGRMDTYTPLLLERGLAAMIGKGARSEEVLRAMRQHGAVYFGFVGGAGALAASHVTAARVVAYEDLGSEAVRLLCVKDFPLTVLADSVGGDWYRLGPQAYLEEAQRRDG